ncbi:iron(III) transport system substrate-binding protein [Salsuginibacillus halophilus]|uniref:Iron(III) transport system substrate-binding protein n=1 Tax=Salsuginibacillus halophilus TaxID=517424 RepID=A0A2P8H8B6_9BACI|nr:extracellular solute-binding protein [Salsuginibacillus halophilus]PSL42452.1 iron(III) transport system substrate-binding protein [Salsuginibacillus halophilus]
MRKFNRMVPATMAAVMVTLAACGEEEQNGVEENGGDEAQSEGEEVEEDEDNDDGEAVDEAEHDGELTVYSARNETFVDQWLESFEEDTGIEVNALHADDNAVNLIQEESENVQADMFISNDIGALEFLRMEGLLQGYEPENVDSIGEEYRAEDDSWVALSARTRAFMYNKDIVDEEDVPNNIADLANDEYEGEFAITRGANGSMIAHVSALRQEWGDEETKEWLGDISENAGAILSGHSDIRDVVGQGEFAFGLVNNYYYHQQLEEPDNNNVGIVYPDQGEGEMGAVLNAAGIGMIEGAPNEENAQVFMDWALEEENQREFSYDSLEVPINPDIEPYDEAASIDDYETHDMPLRELGEVWEDTRELIEDSDMDLEIR